MILWSFFFVRLLFIPYECSSSMLLSLSRFSWYFIKISAFTGVCMKRFIFIRLTLLQILRSAIFCSQHTLVLEANLCSNYSRAKLPTQKWCFSNSPLASIKFHPCCVASQKKMVEVRIRPQCTEKIQWNIFEKKLERHNCSIIACKLHINGKKKADSLLNHNVTRELWMTRVWGGIFRYANICLVVIFLQHRTKQATGSAKSFLLCTCANLVSLENTRFVLFHFFFCHIPNIFAALG